MRQNFQVGQYRPIYLWGGPGTIRMNKIKFMNYPVDDAIHREAHSASAAKLVVSDLHTNWVHLTYDWGFPPEVEVEDWEDFGRAAENYHYAGASVFAYIQTSNCVYQGSYIEKDWYARNPTGRKVFYYSGRYMVDWTHPEWLQHLKDMVKGAIERGADGIFFDNLWYGEEPNSLMKAWLGGAGCYCERCQALYREERGVSIPNKILPDRDEVADYLRWRANQVTATVQRLVEFIHDLKPDVVISANDYDVTMRNSYLIYGIDVEALSKWQDVVMVENFALPRWSPGGHVCLVNNALTLRNTREFVRENAHLSVLSYDVGIGFDPVYPPRRHQQGIGEAAACGASMTIKGTDYNDGSLMTLLTAPAYHPQHKAIGDYHRWLEEHQVLYQERTNCAPFGLLHPEEDLWRHWMEMAPIYYGAGQALTLAGIPWRVIRKGDSLSDLSVILTFTPKDQDYPPSDGHITHVHVPAVPGWDWQKLGTVARGGLWHDLVEAVGLFLLRSYHANKLARQIMDKLNMAKLVTQTPLFDLPDAATIDALMGVLPRQIFPQVEAQQPVLIETWQKGTEKQVHLMNYADQSQEVKVHFSSPVSARIISPDNGFTQNLSGKCLTVVLDIYCILILS